MSSGASPSSFAIFPRCACANASLSSSFASARSNLQVHTVNTHGRRRIHASFMHARIHAFLHACIHVHSCIHAFMHTHVHMSIYTLRSRQGGPDLHHLPLPRTVHAAATQRRAPRRVLHRGVRHPAGPLYAFTHAHVSMHVWACMKVYGRTLHISVFIPSWMTV